MSQNLFLPSNETSSDVSNNRRVKDSIMVVSPTAAAAVSMKSVASNHVTGLQPPSADNEQKSVSRDSSEWKSPAIADNAADSSYMVRVVAPAASDPRSQPAAAQAPRGKFRLATLIASPSPPASGPLSGTGTTTQGHYHTSAVVNEDALQPPELSGAPASVGATPFRLTSLMQALRSERTKDVRVVDMPVYSGPSTGKSSTLDAAPLQAMAQVGSPSAPSTADTASAQADPARLHLDARDTSAEIRTKQADPTAHIAPSSTGRPVPPSWANPVHRTPWNLLTDWLSDGAYFLMDSARSAMGPCSRSLNRQQRFLLEQELMKGVILPPHARLRDDQALARMLRVYPPNPVLAALIRHADCLKASSQLVHPLVRLHVVDLRTGYPYAKSQANRPAVSSRETAAALHNLPELSITAQMTAPCDLKAQGTFEPVWNQVWHGIAGVLLLVAVLGCD